MTTGKMLIVQHKKQETLDIGGNSHGKYTHAFSSHQKYSPNSQHPSAQTAGETAVSTTQTTRIFSIPAHGQNHSDKKIFF